MRIIAGLTSFCVAAALCVAQSTGVPGVNDFTLNGFGSGSTSVTDPGFDDTVASVTMSLTGTPGAPLAGAMAASGAPNVMPIGGGYSLDIDPASLLIFVLPGATLGFPISAVIPAVGPWSLTLPVGFSGGETFALQFGIVDPSNPPLNIVTTQAYAGTVTANCPPGSVFPALGAANNVGPLGDDTGIGLLFGGGATFSFYGTAYTNLWINMNGNLTFVAQDTDFTPSAGELLAQEPRIAPLWADFSPLTSPTGSVRALDDGIALTVEWNDVVMFPSVTCAAGTPPDSNTFGCRLSFATGVIEMKQGITRLCAGGGGSSTGPVPVVGISPGGAPIGTPLSPPNNVDLATGGVPNFNGPTAGAMDAIYEDFTQGVFGGYDLGAQGVPLCETALLFFPAAVPGIGPYSQL